MKENRKQKKFLAYLDEAYKQPIGELCNRINQSRGDVMHPVLYSILCDRVDVAEFEMNSEYKVKKKVRKKQNYDKHRRR